MEKISDDYYIDKVRGGAAECFAPLLARYGRRVFSLVVRIVGNAEDAEEVTQDVFLKAFRSLGQFEGNSSFSTWLYRIAYNMAVSSVRKRRCVYVPIDDAVPADIADDAEEALSQALDTEERVECLKRALAMLPADERAMITLFYDEDRRMDEIAEIMGMTLTNVKTRIFRIRKKLYMMIKQMEDERDRERQ